MHTREIQSMVYSIYMCARYGVYAQEATVRIRNFAAGQPILAGFIPFGGFTCKAAMPPTVALAAKLSASAPNQI